MTARHRAVMPALGAGIHALRPYVSRARRSTKSAFTRVFARYGEAEWCVADPGPTRCMGPGSAAHRLRAAPHPGNVRRRAGNDSNSGKECSSLAGPHPGSATRDRTFLRQEPERHDRGRWTDGPVSREPRRQVAGRRRSSSSSTAPTRSMSTANVRRLSDFARSIADANPSLEVVAESVDVTSEEAVAALFARHRGIRYLQHTAGISPRPLTPPEELTKEDVLNACEVNLWGSSKPTKAACLAQSVSVYSQWSAMTGSTLVARRAGT